MELEVLQLCDNGDLDDANLNEVRNPQRPLWFSHNQEARDQKDSRGAICMMYTNSQQWYKWPSGSAVGESLRDERRGECVPLQTLRKPLSFSTVTSFIHPGPTVAGCVIPTWT